MSNDERFEFFAENIVSATQNGNRSSVLGRVAASREVQHFLDDNRLGHELIELCKVK